MALALVETIPTAASIPDPVPDFDTFWLLWAGKKQEKKLCKLQWGYMLADQQLAAIVGAAAWRPLWLREEWRYLPQPRQWIQGERWEDELPRGVTNGAHVAFTQQAAEGERAVMPEHVKALIAKLKAQKL